MLPTVIGACVIAAAVIWIVAVQIRNRIKGKSSCSCGGNCGACGLDCHGPKSEV